MALWGISGVGAREKKEDLVTGEEKEHVYQFSRARGAAP
jgi:hypothetical protein